MILTLGLVVLLAGGLLPLIQRDLRRAVECRANRRRFAIHRWGMWMAGLSSATQAAAEMERTMAQVAAAMDVSADHVREVMDALRRAGWTPPRN